MTAVCWQTARRNKWIERIEIRPYKESDWTELARVHDSARRVKLEWSGLSDAFLPFAVASVREHLFWGFSLCCHFAGKSVRAFRLFGWRIGMIICGSDTYEKRNWKSTCGICSTTYKASADNRSFGGKCSCIGTLPINGLFCFADKLGKMPGSESFEVMVECLEKK